MQEIGHRVIQVHWFLQRYVFARAVFSQRMICFRGWHLMNWFRLSGILIAFVMSLLWAFDVRGSQSDEEYELLYSTPDKFLQVWSDHKIDQGRCKWIAERVGKAYTFDSQQECWKDQDLLYKNILKIRVVDSMKSKILGYAQGPNLFVVRDSYLDDELSEGTLAHELTHIQDGRQLRGGKLPSFLLEGRALTNGHNYRLSLGQKNNSYDFQMARSAMKFSSADAEEILGEFHSSGWNMEAMGTFLVEYMRTKWNGTGVPNIHQRLARMIERIAGGLDAEAAFAQEFGKPFSALLESFMKYLDNTKGEPAVRLQGTIWESLEPKQANTPDDDD